jgi:predicted DNA-binding transcriptional regulator YafY
LPESSDWFDFFKYSFGIFHNYQEEPINIELEFYNTMIQQIINHPLMPNQKHKLIRSGKALKVEIQVYDSYEIIREILSYGSSVKVISPIELSEKIKSMIQKMLSLYE